MPDNKPNAPDPQQLRRRFDWRSPQFVGLAAAVAVAAIAVPAWAKSDDGLHDQFPMVAGAPGPDGDGFVGRAPATGPPPPGVAAAMLHAGTPDGAPQRDGEVQPLPPPPGGEQGALPPHPPNPFPLSDEEIQHQREVLQDFVDCLRDHGQDVGDPEVGPYEIMIPAGDGGADPGSDEFQQAADDCGRPDVLPPPPPQAPGGP